MSIKFLSMGDSFLIILNTNLFTLSTNFKMKFWKLLMTAHESPMFFNIVCR